MIGQCQFLSVDAISSNKELGFKKSTTLKCIAGTVTILRDKKDVNPELISKKKDMNGSYWMS